jgi:hypothetical protein
MSNSNFMGLDEPNEQTAWRAHVDLRLDSSKQQMEALSSSMAENTLSTAENTAATKQLQSDTSELVDLMKSLKGAFKVIDMLGKLAKPLGYIFLVVTAAIGFWTALKGVIK